MFGNVRVTFGQVLDNFRKSSEGGRKSSEIVKNTAISIFIGVNII